MITASPKLKAVNDYNFSHLVGCLLYMFKNEQNACAIKMVEWMYFTEKCAKHCHSQTPGPGRCTYMNECSVLNYPASMEI